MSAFKYVTDSGIEIKPFYTAADVQSNNEKPGEMPYTRGIQKDMYRGKLWTMRQYAGFSTAEESNKRYHYLLAQGVTGLSVAFDLPTQIGYDSDDALAEGEVGKVGVSIDCLEDMEQLFAGIDLTNVSVSMTINATAFILLAMYVAVAKKQGADLKKLSGTIQNDILKEYAARGTYIYPPEPSMRIITDIFEWCSNELPKWNSISVSGYHIREAGSTAAQELAFTLANGKAYVEAAIAKNLDVNNFGKQISFFFNAHNNFFEEVAKFRAARKLWFNIMKDLGASDAKALMLRFHSQTGGSTLTAQQPLNNISRITLQALAAILGGTQSLHTNGYDEALGLPSEKAAEIALRTQQIIANETGLIDTADPLGGSFFVERLTAEIEEKVLHILHQIDEWGGSIKAIEKGYIQNEIAKSAYEYQQQIEAKTKVIVGVNKYNTEDKEENMASVFRVNNDIEKFQVEKIKKFRDGRDLEKVSTCIIHIKKAATDQNNLMPFIVDAVENQCTLGEISNSLREIFGMY